MSIEETITKKICNLCCDKEADADREVIEYGLALIVESVFKFLLMLVLSIIIGKVWETISFIIVFCSIRSNAGGIHCKTNFGCTASLFGIYFMSLALGYVKLNDWIVLVLGLICFVICLIWAPSSTLNNPITDRSIRLRKKIICLILLVVSFAIYYLKIIDVATGAILTTYISISILVILLEIFKKKR